MTGMSEAAFLGWPQVVAALVACQRLGELALARRNETRLRAQGAVEAGAGHYPLFVGLHTLWLGAVALAVPAGAPVYGAALIAYALLQPLRVWTVASLGGAWTTRILTVPGAPLSRRGPYRWVRHPNYLIVALEIPLLPLAFGAPGLAIGFGVANLALLAWRIRVEEATLNLR